MISSAVSLERRLAREYKKASELFQLAGVISLSGVVASVRFPVSVPPESLNISVYGPSPRSPALVISTAALGPSYWYDLSLCSFQRMSPRQVFRTSSCTRSAKRAVLTSISSAPLRKVALHLSLELSRFEH